MATRRSWFGRYLQWKMSRLERVNIDIGFFMEYWRHVRGFLRAYFDIQKAECGHMAYRSHAAFLWIQFPVEWTL